jgi:hypothetical protein
MTGPIATAFWRMALAVPVLWMFMRLQNDASSPLLIFRAPLVWLAGFAFALDLTAWHFSIRLTSVTNATLLANCAVLLVPLFSWFFLRRPIALLAGEKLLPSCGRDWVWLIVGADLASLWADCHRPCAGPHPLAQAAVGLGSNPCPQHYLLEFCSANRCPASTLRRRIGAGFHHGRALFER